MEYKEAVTMSRQRKLVEDDKFDRHMRRARIGDIESRRSIFCNQTQGQREKETQRTNIKSSTY